LLAVNRRKKEVERLLFQLESFSDPKELTQNQKDAKTTRQAVKFDLTSMQQSREQSDLELSSIVDNKDLLKNFQLEAPPMEGGKIVDPIKAYAAVALWSQKAMATNKSLLLFAANTKDMLEDQLSQVEDKLNLSNQTIVLLKKEEQRLKNEISVLKRHINEFQIKLKNLVQRIESMTSRIKTMENEFKVRTNALRDEITGMKKELNAMSHQLHLVTVERDALSVQVTAMEQQIRQLEVNLAKAIQELQVMHLKYD
jgi:chromosome segregation ATPase